MFSQLKRRIRNIFIAGLLITLPVAFTIFIFNFLLKVLDGSVSPYVTKMLIYFGVPILEDFRVPGLGLFMMVLVIFIIGLLTTNIFGKQLVHWGEKIVEKIPIVRNIYTGAKQVVTTIASADTKAFSKVVVLEFPRKGVYAMGFLTSVTKGEVQAKTKKDVGNIFVPTTPNPTSGFLVFVPKEDYIELDMSTEEGIKLIISCGIVTPAYHQKKLIELKDKKGIKG